MPESGAKSHQVNNGKPVQSINPRQSSWLTHWTGIKLQTSKHDHVTQLSKSEEYDHDIDKHPTGVEIGSDHFECSKVIKDVDLTMSLKQQSSESFPFFKSGLESGKCVILNEGVQALEPQVSHKKLTTGFHVEASSSECHLKAELASQIPTEQVKYHMFFGESSHLCSQPSNQGAFKPDSHTTHGPENFRHLKAAFASKDHFPKSEKSEMPLFSRQDEAAHLKTDPSTSSQRPPSFTEERYKRMQKHIGMGFFPHQSGSLQHTNSRTLHHEQCSFQNVPHFVHDLEMTRMSGGLHSFSRTTHSLLITKQTDIKVYQESQIFRESRVSTQLKEEALRELNCSPPHFSQSQQGAKLQLLDSSDHESEENVKEYKASGDVQKNESSADTDAMDMEAFKENQLDVLHVSPPNKDTMVESNILLPPVTSSTQKDRPRKRKIELPDINLDISALPATSSSNEKAEPCTSRTQSLDMNTLHFNVDQTSNLNFNECSNINLGSEPGSRWIKRLRLSETSPHGKLNRLLPRVMEGNNPEPPVLDKHHGKKPESLTGKAHHKSSEIQIGETSSVEAKQQCKDVTLSHAWIRRWSHKQNQKNPETLETCKLENFKLATDEYEKKQFPSIAAMALMGKAMSGFQQCKFQKKESFVVWNTKAFD